jgi:hypothetical protein
VGTYFCARGYVRVIESEKFHVINVLREHFAVPARVKALHSRRFVRVALVGRARVRDMLQY